MRAQPALLALLLAAPLVAQDAPAPTESRLEWWREARFGLFIHWGLYAIPEGRWGGKDGYGEWIRHSAEIPVDVYDRLVDRFAETMEELQEEKRI